MQADGTPDKRVKGNSDSSSSSESGSSSDGEKYSPKEHDGLKVRFYISSLFPRDFSNGEEGRDGRLRDFLLVVVARADRLLSVSSSVLRLCSSRKTARPTSVSHLITGWEGIGRGLRSWARRVGKLAVEGRTQTDELDVELDPKRFVCRRSLGGET